MIYAGACHSQQPRPEWNRLLREYGGVTLYGDPFYRIVWSGSHTVPQFRKFTDKDPHNGLVRRVFATRAVLKYRLPWQRERWIVERLVPAHLIGTKPEWLARTRTIMDGIVVDPFGPYPYRGEYRFCDAVEDGGSYVEPTPTYLMAVVDRMRGILDQDLADFLTASEQAERLKHEMAAKKFIEHEEFTQEQRVAATENAIYENIKDANRPFAHLPRTWLTGLTIPRNPVQKEL